ncbi:MAG: transcription elongation factor GreA [Thermoleophilaceae bacterium]
MEQNVMTAEDLEALRAEVAELETAGRAAIAAEIKTAREWGDLKENAEYHAAKDAQGHLEARINKLLERIRTATVVEAVTGDVAGFGSTLEVEDDSGRQLVYRIVSSRDAEPAKGLLSSDSPMAAALAGCRPGDVAVVSTPKGERKLRVVTVR